MNGIVWVRHTYLIRLIERRNKFKRNPEIHECKFIRIKWFSFIIFGVKSIYILIVNELVYLFVIS